ncbi:hypothetical protein JAAARDRAFT_201361 [Jaapia argillacea MUCL 33604]|uniref:Uncharacterized protein n=1 Tax=Jaapia argillacea MUCL 33604 TaxID=933084 RepID=A0A067PEI9_9AGAM|nr:hypothetical protein JAAARDRAFT_201361 [Jaapia argillacea MUCL 33604]
MSQPPAPAPGILPGGAGTISVGAALQPSLDADMTDDFDGRGIFSDLMSLSGGTYSPPNPPVISNNPPAPWTDDSDWFPASTNNSSGPLHLPSDDGLSFATDNSNSFDPSIQLQSFVGSGPQPNVFGGVGVTTSFNLSSSSDQDLEEILAGLEAGVLLEANPTHSVLPGFPSLSVVDSFASAPSSFSDDSSTLPSSPTSSGSLPGPAAFMEVMLQCLPGGAGNITPPARTDIHCDSHVAQEGRNTPGAVSDDLFIEQGLINLKAQDEHGELLYIADDNKRGRRHSEHTR